MCMKDMKRTKIELVKELVSLRERVARAEAALDRDGTRQREGKDSVDALSSKLALAQRIARLGCWEWDLGTGVQVWTDEIYTILGVESGAFQPSFEACLDHVHPDDRHRFRAAMNRARTDPDTGISLHHRIVTRSGIVRHVHTRGEVVREAGEQVQRMVGTCQDVTDQTLVDTALLESERRFALFMDHLPAAVMIKSREGKVLYHNKFMDEIFSPALFRSTPARDGSARKIIGRMLSDDRRALKNGRHEREEQVPDADGRHRWLHTVKFAIPGDEEAPLLGGISWDITARRDAEAALQESEIRYRSLWDSAPVGLWLEDFSAVVRRLEELQAKGMFDFDAHFDEHPDELKRCAALVDVLSVNQAAVDMNRAESAEALCGRLDDLLDEQSLLSFRRILKAIAEGRTTLDFESEIRTTDGETRDIAMRLFTPPEYSRTWQKTIIAATDFTEQKRLWRTLALRTRELATLRDLTGIAGSEDTLETVLDASVRSVLEAVNPDFICVFMNDEEGLNIRRTCLDSVVGHEPPPDQMADLERCVTDAAGSGVPVYAEDLAGPFLTHAALPLSSGNDLIGVLGLANREAKDFVAQAPFLETLANEIALAVANCQLNDRIREFGARLEGQVAASTLGLSEVVRRARATGDVRTDLLDQVSHELRTPLTSIIGFIGIILQGLAGALNEEQHRQLGMAGESAANLLALVDDVIDLTRLETGRYDVGREGVDIGRLVARAERTASAAAEAKGLVLSTDVSVDLPEVLGDAGRIQKILDQLLDNALKFTSSGTVTVACRREGDRVETRVADTGPGIPQHALDRIFEPFQDADSTTGTRIQGTGLGLYLCRSITELMGGTLTVDSVTDSGSTFVLRLPVEETP
jgi:PAS domain S-box-containing protein